VEAAVSRALAAANASEMRAASRLLNRLAQSLARIADRPRLRGAANRSS
jgi:hypothetical protein